jgi:DNA-binding LytR/AlgR family response regulator
MSSAVVHLHPSPETPRRLVFPCGRRTFYVRPADLLWAEAEANYSRIHTTSGAFLVRELIGQLESRLAPHGFLRVHRSIVINLEQLVEIRRMSRYKQCVVLAGGTQLPLADDYRDALERSLMVRTDGIR